MKKDIIRVSRNIMLPVMILLFSLRVSAEAADTKRAQAPPPGWQAAGESVAGPEETSAAVQTAARGSADAQIRHERDAQVRKTDNKGYIYYSVLYGEYDEYPHARPLEAADNSGYRT